jgi:hypothetical protein
MTPDEEPKTDVELAQRLRALYVAGDHSGAARDDFWDTVSFHIGWIVDLVEVAAKIKRRRNDTPNPKSQAAGRARSAALSPERRAEISRAAANARWHPEQS